MCPSTLLCCALLWTTAMSCSSPQFACSDGTGCVPKTSLCDYRNDCDDQSDEEICSETCPLGSLPCGEGSDICYATVHHCDGHVDCDNGADEESCPVATCSSAEESCRHGPCVRRDSLRSCCPVENNHCSTDPQESESLSRLASNKLIYTREHTVIVVDLFGKEQKTFNCTDGITDVLPVTAFAYEVATETLFWTVGQMLCKAGLHNVGETQGKFEGDLEPNCSISDMAYDYINGSFYFLCDAERIINCRLGIETTEMFCVTFETMKNIKSIALRADKRLLYIGSGVGTSSVIHQRSTTGAATTMEDLEVRATIQRRSMEFASDMPFLFSAEFTWETIDWISRYNITERIRHFSRKYGSNDRLFVFPRGIGPGLVGIILNPTIDHRLVSLYDSESQPGPQEDNADITPESPNNISSTHSEYPGNTSSTPIRILERANNSRRKNENLDKQISESLSAQDVNTEDLKSIHIVSAMTLALCLLCGSAYCCYEYRGKIFPRRTMDPLSRGARKYGSCEHMSCSAVELSPPLETFRRVV